MRFDGRARVSARIDLAPLIDVVFLLLVFFLLTSSFVSREAIDLVLPASSTGAPTPTPLVSVTVAEDESVQVDGRPVEWSGLETFLARALSQSGRSDVAVFAAGGVDVSTLVAVLDAARAAGASGVSLGTRRGASEAVHTAGDRPESPKVSNQEASPSP